MASLHGHTRGNAAAYVAYVGRWSCPMAEGVLRWLQPGPGLDWLDVGGGAGALTSAILDLAAPRMVTGIDPSAAFLDTARAQIPDTRVQFAVASAGQLPFSTASFDVVIAGLVLHLVPDPATAIHGDSGCRTPRRVRCRLRLGLCRGAAIHPHLLEDRDGTRSGRGLFWPCRPVGPLRP